jgi:hypothetical protein
MINHTVDCTEPAACLAEAAGSQHAQWPVQEA